MTDIDFFAHDPDEVVQPWQPKVGDRVRIVVGDGAEYTCRCLNKHRTDFFNMATGVVVGLGGVKTDRNGIDYIGVSVRYCPPLALPCMGGRHAEYGCWLAYELEPYTASIGADGAEITNEESPRRSGLQAT